MQKNREAYEFPEEEMEQNYKKYTEKDQKIWHILFEKQQLVLENKASKEFLKGIDICGFVTDAIPKVEVMNKNLRAATGWEMYVVPGLIADKPFFEYLSNKKFPVSTWIRSVKELDYLEEPDMFHDFYGHVPLLSNQPFVDFIQGLAKIALKYIDNPYAIELLSRLYWFSIEFGLIKEDGKLKIYGAGILSSAGESYFSVTNEDVPRFRYDVRHIFKTPYYKHDYQRQYFVINSYEDLYKSLKYVEPILLEELKMEPETYL
ncbi:MAG: phenylalanine 4-monooxygenase [Chitinophagales bacterium]